MALPLEGVRILDLTQNPVGWFASMMLADFGAEVIKVEGPLPTGRRAIAPAQQAPGQGSPQEERDVAYRALDRNKQSIVLDLKQEAARRVFFKLAERSDVVLEGYRPGVMKRLGVDFQKVSGIIPRIIYCAITGYGQDGPYRDLPGHDINYISIGGALGLIGSKHSNPSIPLNLVGDFAGGSLHAVIGILLALKARDQTGQGQLVDIAMTDGVAGLLTMFLTQYFSTGQPVRRGEYQLSGAAPYYNTYETKDGKYISVGSIEPWFYQNLCAALGREDFLPYQHDPAKYPEIFRAFREIFKTRTRDEWFELLTGTDICAGKVYDMEELPQDPQLVHRQMFVEKEHPKAGKVKQVGIAIKLSKTPGSVRQLAPTRGQDTDALLAWLGYSEADIARLRNAEAVG